MNDRFVESREAVMYAREALKNGATNEAREWAERATELAPQNEDGWLILAAVSEPKKSLEYTRKALEANPNSPRAKQGMEWAQSRLGGDKPKIQVTPEKAKQAKGPARSEDVKKTKKRSRILPILLIVMGMAVFLFAAWSAVRSPVMASILSGVSSSNTAQLPPKHSFAQVAIPKPVSNLQPVAVPQVDVAPTFTLTPPAEATEVPSVADVIPTSSIPNADVFVLPTDTVIPTVETTESTGVAVAEIVQDTPTAEYVAPTAAAVAATSPEVSDAVANGVHWIDVDLSQQRLYAYAGDTLVNQFVVSTGTWQTPTVTGSYKVWIKLRSADMTGPGYYLPDVPYVMYFYQSYGLHGTYWHNNFGTPMSHGCVNLSIPDAEWLYNFSSVGTVVNVHY